MHSLLKYFIVKSYFLAELTLPFLKKSNVTTKNNYSITAKLSYFDKLHISK